MDRRSFIKVAALGTGALASSSLLNTAEAASALQKSVKKGAAKPVLPPFPTVGKAFSITNAPFEHLLANYFGINPWSSDNRYIAVLETDIKGRLPEADEAALVYLIDRGDHHRMIKIGKTYCWNFQEACMFHWLPWEDGACVWNDRRDGKFVAVVSNWKTKTERIIPRPISAVSEDGEWAVSINYARLRLTRPDYGYAGNGQDPLRNVAWPDNDGLWLVNLRTGEEKLILSVKQAQPLMTKIDSPDGLAYFCHTVISKDGSKIFFLARTVGDFQKQLDARGHIYIWRTTSFTCNIDGSNLRRCFPDGWEGSHFNWKDGKTLAVTAKWDAGKTWSHTIFDVGEEDKVKHLAPGLMDWDGHCVFSPDGQFLSSDGYWDSNSNRRWVLVRLQDEEVMPIGEFFVPDEYKETYTRCDLHARWRPDGKQLAFNSVHDGSRQVYLRNVEW